MRKIIAKMSRVNGCNESLLNPINCEMIINILSINMCHWFKTGKNIKSANEWDCSTAV